MDRFKKSLSLRKKKNAKTPEEDPNNKPISWQEDEKKVREGYCSFQVKYLGFIEVFDSRGMQVCEEAIKALRRPKKKTIRAILYVSGDTIRVSDEISKGLVVDQTIEKVSFCSPDRNYKRGFAYICRDGTTRRWMCHAFLAVKETGERLSHAVGCAFAICLEKKQKRESDVTQPIVTESRAFTKGSSFRQTSLTERLQDPQSAIIADLPTSMSPHIPTAIAANSASPDHSSATVIPRPHASASFFTERQTSLRMFPKLQESSPFKRELSLRLAELPGTSPLIRKADVSISEDGNEYFGCDNRDISDNSSSESPAHRMSASFQSDSPSIMHRNPFLLSGTINYGALSAFASQEAINNNMERKENSSNGIQPKLEHNVADSFHILKVSENCSVQTITTPTNGFPAMTNFESLPNQWQSRSPFNSITTPYEIYSTNPWSESSHHIQSELIHSSMVVQPSQAKSNTDDVTSIKYQSDPFDISWINRNCNVNPTGILTNNPFRM